MKIIIVDGDGQSAAKTEEMLASAGQEWEISGVVQDGRTGYKLISEKKTGSADYGSYAVRYERFVSSEKAQGR